MTSNGLPITYQFTVDAVYFEFALVIFMVIIASLTSVIRMVNLSIHEKIRASVQQYLINLCDHHQPFKYRWFHFFWKRLDVLLEVVDKMDARQHNEHWIEIRPAFIQSVIFPIAIDFSRSCQWKKRLYAVQAFGLLRERKNNLYIEALVNDRIPLVAIYAGKVALLNHTENAIHALIKRIGHARWGAQLLDLHSFNVYPPESKPYFLKKLHAAADPRIRAACYKVLTRYKPEKIDWDIRPDVFSSDSELKISALKFVTHEERDLAIPLLIETLNMKNSNEIRLIALHCLSLLKASEAIPTLTECLKDSNWWIKVSAAEALQNLGPEGSVVLKKEGIDIDSVTYNVNQTLNTWW